MLYLTGNSENIIYTNVSVNKELSNPTYLMSLTHQQTLKKWTFIPQNITPQSGTPYNSRYDIFKFNLVDENTPEDLTGGTRAWYYQSSPNYVYDDARFQGTGLSYPKMNLWTENLNFFAVQFDWADTDDRMDDVNDTGFTVTINDAPYTGNTSVFRQSQGGGIDEGRIANVQPNTFTNPPIPFEDVYKISYTGTSTGGTSMTGTIYVPTGQQVIDAKPWEYYGDMSPIYNKSYPITHINTPNIEVDEIGEFRYAIYEEANPVGLNTSTAYNQLEVGLAYITQLFSDTFYDDGETSEVYDPDLDYPSPTPSSTPTPTPSATASPTPTPSITPSVTPTITPTPSSTPVIPFDPISISGLSAWYDFSDSGNTQLSGSEILTAYDQSGNGLDIISPSGKRPILTADTISNISGQTSAVFTYSGAEYLYNTSMNITLSSGYTWFYVMDFDPSGVTTERSLMYLYGATNNETKATNYYNYSTEDSIRTQYPGAEFDGYSTLTSQFPKSLMWSKVGYPNTPYAQFDAQLNGVLYTSAISDTFNMVDIDLLYLPGPFTGSVGNDIRIGELLIYNRQLDSSEISQVENWLKNKWNYTNW